MNVLGLTAVIRHASMRRDHLAVAVMKDSHWTLMGEHVSVGKINLLHSIMLYIRTLGKL